MGRLWAPRASKRCPGVPKITKSVPKVVKKGAQSVQKSSKMISQNNKNKLKTHNKTPQKLLENRRAFCPSDDWNKKRATRDPTYIISDIYYSIDIRVARVRARSRARARARVRTWVWEPV